MLLPRPMAAASFMAAQVTYWGMALAGFVLLKYLYCIQPSMDRPPLVSSTRTLTQSPPESDIWVMGVPL